jgi:hypothetical protein
MRHLKNDAEEVDQLIEIVGKEKAELVEAWKGMTPYSNSKSKVL